MPTAATSDQMLTTDPRHNRRADVRQTVHRPVKLRPPSTVGRYLAGRTRNISAGGALIELNRPASLNRGDTVRLAIADHDDVPLLTADGMIAATVLRRDPAQPARIAVRFAERQPA